MKIIDKISDSYRIDASESYSTEEELKKLRDFSEIEIPQDYLDIISYRTEIEISVRGEKYIRIWGAVGCIDMNEAYHIQDYIPCSLAIGDDEGGNAQIYATGEKGFGLYIIAFNDLDEEEMLYVADSLSDLLLYNNGIEVILNS